MKWGALVATAWVLMGAVAGGIGRPDAVHVRHDAADAAEAAAIPAATIVSGEEACWSDYVERAIQIYANLIACVKDNEWYDAFGYLICELSYEFAAFMAFMRLMACMST